MNRKQPDNSEPPPVTKWSDGEQPPMIGGTQVVVQERHYRLITPLFGGGFEPGVNDPDNLIRATEIRGQLRFWWRAIRGGQPEFGGSIEKMKAREDEIWGTASNTRKREKGDGERKSPEEAGWNAAVQIVVEINSAGEAIKPYIPKWNKQETKIIAPPHPDIPGYAAFPLRPSEEELNRAKQTGGPDRVFVENVRAGIIFTLHLSFPERWTREVGSALWAWETFGGIGARTRRGFGTICLDKASEEELPPAHADEAEEWLKNKLREFLEGENRKFLGNVPHINPTMEMRVLGPFSRAQDAWSRLIKALNEFRQHRFGPYGASKWPEAEALRRRLHPSRGPSAGWPDKFPRAAFGLPIVFHLPHEKPAENITLQGAGDGEERLASSLILKAFPCRNNQFLGLAVLLTGSDVLDLPARNLALTRDGKLWDTLDVKQTTLKSREVPTLNKLLRQETDVLKAFMDHLKSERR